MHFLRNVTNIIICHRIRLSTVDHVHYRLSFIILPASRYPRLSGAGIGCVIRLHQAVPFDATRASCITWFLGKWLFVRFDNLTMGSVVEHLSLHSASIDESGLSIFRATLRMLKILKGVDSLPSYPHVSTTANVLKESECTTKLARNGIIFQVIHLAARV